LSSGQQRIIFKERAGSAMTSPWGDKEMAEREEVGDRTIRVPEHMIETINRLVRTSRQMLTEIGREPTPEELAEKLAMPLEKVLRVLNIAKQPITLAAPIGAARDPDLG
jgi:DNA-directed RNA polymerase sigma subunit (sigma70/sigma32)